jgi:transcriptional regulator with XRE-family HTH domain
MENNTLEKLGKRIRLYRKSKNLSLDELAALIYKSKASLSKYELGQIPMDVLTLQNIADALGVAPFHLLEYSPTISAPTPSISHLFGTSNQLYLYHMSGKTVHSSVLEIGPTDQSGQIHSTLYYKVNNPESLDQCHCIYHGHVYTHDLVISFFLRNYHNSVENILISAKVPMYNTTAMIGMICGLDSSTLAPTAKKILLFRHPVENREMLADLCKLHPDTIKDLRRTNSFDIRDETELPSK